MKTTKTIFFTLAMLALMGVSALAQNESASNNKKEKSMKEKSMNTYVIEREIPDAGKLNAQQLQGISQTSCKVLKELGPGIEWVHSYVAGNKIYCIYKAENENILRTHAEKGGFPINSVSQLSTVISPATATAPLGEIMQ